MVLSACTAVADPAVESSANDPARGGTEVVADTVEEWSCEHTPPRAIRGTPFLSFEAKVGVAPDCSIPGGGPVYAHAGSTLIEWGEVVTIGTLQGFGPINLMNADQTVIASVTPNPTGGPLMLTVSIDGETQENAIDSKCFSWHDTDSDRIVWAEGGFPSQTTQLVAGVVDERGEISVRTVLTEVEGTACVYGWGDWGFSLGVDKPESPATLGVFDPEGVLIAPLPDGSWADVSQDGLVLSVLSTTERGLYYEVRDLNQPGAVLAEFAPLQVRRPTGVDYSADKPHFPIAHKWFPQSRKAVVVTVQEPPLPSHVQIFSAEGTLLEWYVLPERAHAVAVSADERFVLVGTRTDEEGLGGVLVVIDLFDGSEHRLYIGGRVIPLGMPAP